jgi:hypothetical protein
MLKPGALWVPALTGKFVMTSVIASGNWGSNLRTSKGAGVYDGISTGRTKWAKNLWRKHPFAA